MWYLGKIGNVAANLFRTPVYIGRNPGEVPGPALIFLPYRPNVLACGLAGIITVKGGGLDVDAASDLKKLAGLVDRAGKADLPSGESSDVPVADCLGGADTVKEIQAMARRLKEPEAFYALFSRKELAYDLEKLTGLLSELVAGAAKHLDGLLGRMAPKDLEQITFLVDALKDAHWCLGRNWPAIWKKSGI
jgi:glucosamine--fructose-6-phosphate aminotransferase (isomerizing)